MDPRYRLPSRPVADKAAVVQGDRFRITVLADGLLRLEYADDGHFEDRASAFALFRDLPVPDYRVIEFGKAQQFIEFEGINLDASFVITDKAIQGEGTDPGLLLRGQAKSYLQKKFGAVLDPSKSLADVKGTID